MRIGKMHTHAPDGDGRQPFTTTPGEDQVVLPGVFRLTEQVDDQSSQSRLYCASIVAPAGGWVLKTIWFFAPS